MCKFCGKYELNIARTENGNFTICLDGSEVTVESMYYDADKIKIKYCPFCGRNLGGSI